MRGKTKLGQHFLTDTEIAQREIQYADITKEDVVLEIGPGKGVLTRIIGKKAKYVIAVELDQKLVEILKTTLPKNVNLIHQDALDLDFKKLPSFNKIVSNLPFQISSPITFKFLETDFSKAVLIYQKDFAKRMIAQVGSKDYSRLSVHLYYKTKCTILEEISKECFDPKPRVDACIVEIIPRDKPPFVVENETYFFKLINLLFSHRRKKIKNTLSKKISNYSNLPYMDCRVEELSPEQIANLSDILYKNNQKIGVN